MAQAEVELVMVEEPGCIYCARWNAEVGDAYALTPEGRAAPLRRVELDAIPDDLTLTALILLTPTFILVDDDGQELARLVGYPGEDFFWGLLGQMLQAQNIDISEDDGVSSKE